MPINWKKCLEIRPFSIIHPMQMSGFFTIQDHSLSLRDWHSKRSYLYFTISLTEMLINPEKEIAPTIQKACKALMQSEMNHDLLKKLVLFQARQIYDAHVAYRQHIRTFWNDVSCKNK